MGRLGQFTDLTGQVFGRLTVLRLDHVEERLNGSKGNRKVRYWFCQCACGNTKVIRGTHAVDNPKWGTRSCGCLSKELHKSAWWHIKSRKPGTAFRRCLDQYKANAKNRGLCWELTDEQFRELTQSPCYYTGLLPSNVKRVKLGEEYIFNGIDRLDNTKGYILENCVPCCEVINTMKMALTKDRFVQLCKMVAERFNQ